MFNFRTSKLLLNCSAWGGGEPVAPLRWGCQGAAGGARCQPCPLGASPSSPGLPPPPFLSQPPGGCSPAAGGPGERLKEAEPPPPSTPGAPTPLPPPWHTEPCSESVAEPGGEAPVPAGGRSWVALGGQRSATSPLGWEVGGDRSSSVPGPDARWVLTGVADAGALRGAAPRRGRGWEQARAEPGPRASSIERMICCGSFPAAWSQPRASTDDGFNCFQIR